MWVLNLVTKPPFCKRREIVEDSIWIFPIPHKKCKRQFETYPKLFQPLVIFDVVILTFWDVLRIKISVAFHATFSFVFRTILPEGILFCFSGVQILQMEAFDTLVCSECKSCKLFCKEFKFFKNLAGVLQDCTSEPYGISCKTIARNLKPALKIILENKLIRERLA